MYTESHPEVIRVKAEIEMLRGQMQHVAAAPATNTTLLDLERERDTTKKIYEDLLSTLRKSEVSAQIEVQDKAGAFRILDPAVVPTKPLSPNMVNIILLAIIAGIAAGGGIIWLADSADDSVKSVETLKKMGLPILAVISTMKTEQETAAIRKKDHMVYTIAGVYLACVLTIAASEAMGFSFMGEVINGTRHGIGNTVKKIFQKA
jgi:hypothetical protein